MEGKKWLIIIAIIVAVSVIVVDLITFVVVANNGTENIKNITDNKNGTIACSLEAKVCPDGSAVGRTGPNCEFATCPATSTTQIVKISDPLNFNDLRRYISQEFKWNYDDVNISIVSRDETHIRASFTLLGMVGGKSNGIILLEKVNDQWLMVYDGNKSGYTCESIEAYDFPLDMTNDCIDLKNPDIEIVKKELIEELKTQSNWSKKGWYLLWVQKDGNYLRARITNGAKENRFDFFASYDGVKWNILIDPFNISDGYSCEKLSEFPIKMKNDCIASNGS